MFTCSCLKVIKTKWADGFWYQAKFIFQAQQIDNVQFNGMFSIKYKNPELYEAGKVYTFSLTELNDISK